MKTEIKNENEKIITSEEGMVLTNGGEFDIYPTQLICGINDNSWYEINGTLIKEFIYQDFEPEKIFEVSGKKDNYLELLSDYPELGIYRKQTNLMVHYNEDTVYFYTNQFLPGHREILENYLIIKQR